MDETRRLQLNIAAVELPDGTQFEQYVLRMPPAAIVAVVDDQSRVLMMWRHRFIIDRWVWELPGGYVESTEDAALAAAREVEEETGWRPGPLEHIMTVQPMVGSADAANELFISRGAHYIGRPSDINEAARVTWIDLSSVPGRIAAGEIVGAASVIALQYALSSSRL